MKKALAAAALSLVAAGCGTQTHTSNSATTATTTPHAQAVRAWVELTKGYMQDLGIALGEASLAASKQDYAGLKAACHQAHDAASALQSQIPTPDKELTDALRASLSDFDTASHFCVAAVEDNDANEARHTDEFASSAEGHLTTATTIRDRIVAGS